MVLLGGIRMSIYDFVVEDLDGNDVSLKRFKDRVMLIVNTATQCGFTPQYDGLQDMYEKYSDQGFVVLDFPCNQFGHQAPGTDEEIYSFCDSKFGITFPHFAKIDVNGENQSPLFEYLKQEKGFEGFGEGKMANLLKITAAAKDIHYKSNPDIKWNFTKFLIDRDGNVVARFEPTVDMDIVEQAVKDLL